MHGLELNVWLYKLYGVYYSKAAPVIEWSYLSVQFYNNLYSRILKFAIISLQENFISVHHIV